MSNLLHPPSLESGQTIAIVSTARKISKEEVNSARTILEEWGFKVVYGEHLFEEHHQFAGTDEQRAADLQWAIDSADVHGILCARGGYGTVRIVDRIHWSRLAESPKWIAGYSDVTVLHNRLTARGIASLHSTMPINFGANTPEALQSLRNALEGRGNQYEWARHDQQREGEAEAVLCGGNLSILYSLNGTNDKLNTRGKILFIEDLDEYLYHIDRIMQNFRKSGMLDGLAGLIVGGMTGMNDNTIPFGADAIEIISNAVADYTYPVSFGFPAGHFNDNRTLIMGKTARLSVTSSGCEFSQ